jgi:hypothetical protein
MECGLTWDAMDALSSTRFLTMRKIRAPSFSICWIAEENRRTPSLSMQKFGNSVESKRRIHAAPRAIFLAKGTSERRPPIRWRRDWVCGYKVLDEFSTILTIFYKCVFRPMQVLEQ